MVTRDQFDRMVVAVARAAEVSPEDAARQLQAQGVRPDLAPMAPSYVEACEIYGALQDMRPLQDICDDYGWSDPGLIQHVALAATRRRKFIVLQQEEDGQPQVQVYVYSTEDTADAMGRWWMLDTPVVVAS